MTHFSLKKMVAAEGNGFFEAKNTACSEYYPSFQVNQNKVFFLLLRTYILMTLTFRVTVHQFFCTKIAPTWPTASWATATWATASWLKY